MDTGEFLLGSVGVTPVLFESNGAVDPETQNWSAAEIDQALAKVSEGVGWWSDTLDALNTVHSLDFVIDDTYALNPVETPYEPIDRASSEFSRYVSKFLATLGYGTSGSIEDAVRRFNQDQRAKLGTDWAFTIFVVDSSDDPDGKFSSGGPFATAFAYAGGLFLVTPSTRPASTIAHEMGHVFWARDEYPGGGSWTDRRGYYNAQNLNAADNTTPGFQQEPSIMRGGTPLTTAYTNHVSSASTLAMVGWQDSDNDGIFDLADVPLELDAVGYYDPASTQYHFSGVASAVPLMNQNSSGPQSDITLNRISELQYSLDNGPWITAAQPDQQIAEFDLSLVIDQPFSAIRWRVVDATTGVSSAIMQGTSALPAIAQASVSGLAFLDEDANGQRNPKEMALVTTEIVVRKADGSALFDAYVDASDYGFANGTGAMLAADGLLSGQQVRSFASSELGGQFVFQSFDQSDASWTERWSSEVALEATLDQPVGEVAIRGIGLDGGSYARVEAFDSSGLLIGRVTSSQISPGQSSMIEMSDAMGRISKIRAYGHAETSVAFDQIDFGTNDTGLTDDSGVLRFPNLPDGDYIIDLVPELLIHEFVDSSVEITVVDGVSDFVMAAARRVDSPRHNAAMAEDVSQDGIVTAQDALLVINDLSRLNSRTLLPSDLTGFDIDVNNDGRVTAIDALIVINHLDPQNREDGESGDLSNDSPSDRLLMEASAAKTSNVVTADLALTELTAQPASMFDSAGSDNEDERIGNAEADNSDQPLVEHERLARFQAFASIPDSNHPEVESEIALNGRDNLTGISDPESLVVAWSRPNNRNLLETSRSKG